MITPAQAHQAQHTRTPVYPPGDRPGLIQTVHDHTGDPHHEHCGLDLPLYRGPLARLDSGDWFERRELHFTPPPGVDPPALRVAREVARLATMRERGQLTPTGAHHLAGLLHAYLLFTGATDEHEALAHARDRYTAHPTRGADPS